jgi:hypothetical protein
MLLSSPGGLLLSSRLYLVSDVTGALLVSLFTVEWGCYAWARDLAVLEFCLFLVVFAALCFSSVSPRFYFRKHAFCFLPLVTILESLKFSEKQFLLEFLFGGGGYC